MVKKSFIALICIMSFFAFSVTIYAENTENLWEISSNGTLTAYNGNETSVTVPEYVNGIRVTSLGSVFSGNTLVTSVSLSSGISSLDSYAFSGCTSLTTIIGSDRLETIGEFCFLNCTSLKELSLMGIKEIKRPFYLFNKLNNAKSSDTSASQVDSGTVNKLEKLTLGADLINDEEIKFLGRTVQTLYNYSEKTVCDASVVYCIPNSNQELNSQCAHSEVHNIYNGDIISRENVFYNGTLCSYKYSDFDMVIPSYLNGSAVNYTCYKAFENSGMPLKSVIYPSTITETNQILNNSELEKIVYCPNYKTTSLKLNNLPKLKALVIPGQRVSLSIDDETKNGLTIYAPSDSYAHEWAENNNITFVAYESPAAPENYEFPIRITSADNVDGMLKVSFECYDDVDSFDIILAEYDDNGNVISTQTRTVPQMSNIEFEKHFTPVSGSYKIFVWNDKQVPYSDVWQS